MTGKHRNRPKYIQLKIREDDAEDLLDLLRDELEDGEPEAEDRPAFVRIQRETKNGLQRLDARLERMDGYGIDE